MPIDPRIALGYQPPQQPSPMNVMAQMQALQNARQENAMRQAQMENYASEVSRRNALLPAELAEAKFKAEKEEAARKKGEHELAVAELDRQMDHVALVNNQAGWTAWRNGVVAKDPNYATYIPEEFTPDNKVSALSTAKTARDQIAKDLETTTVSLGGTTEGITRTGKTMWSRKETLSPADRAREARESGDDRAKVASTTTDNAGNVHHWNKFGEEINAGAGTGKGKPSATFEKTQAQQKQMKMDLDSTISELEKATAKDGLIQKATGSGIGAGADWAAGLVGKATEGSIAIGALKPIYDKVLKMVPRFEGPQSDKDTASYNDAAGNLANPNTPKDTKMAAAKEILRLMKARKAQFVTRDMAEGGGATAETGGWKDL